MRIPNGWFGLVILLFVFGSSSALAKETFRCMCSVSPKGKSAFSEPFDVCAMSRETAQVGANRRCEAKHGFSRTGTWNACTCRFRDCTNTRRHCGD